MKLLTKELIKKFEKQGNTNGKPSDEINVIAKFFDPSGSATWYAIEWLPEEEVFFGFVSLFNDHNDELGYFSLKELKEYRSRFGLRVERDLFFQGCTLEEILNGARP